MSSSHQNKVILITGAGRGLGRAYAERLATEGARIAIAEIDPSEGDKAATELCRQGHDAIFIETDVSSESSTEAMADRALSKWNRIDGLVANAGLANSI